MKTWIVALLSLLGLAWPLAPAAAPEAVDRVVVSAGRKVAVHQIPGRGPPVVLDAGGGLDSSYWSSLAPELAKITGSEIITYDRAGFGASDEAPGPWSVTAARDDLAAVLTSVQATRQVILVSHSLAGEIALYLVKQHPDWFAGAVLVDANVPDFFTDEIIAAQTAAYAPAIAAAEAAPPSPGTRQLLAVAASFEATSKAFHREAWPASVPVAVIVSEKTPFDDPAAAKAWRDAHAQFAGRAANRPLVTAAGSSHDVAHDRPDVIIHAVSEMVAAAREDH